MSYRFQPDAIYRMPTHFGPNPGPRQRLDGGRHSNDDAPIAEGAWATWPCASDAVAALLPPGFEPAENPSLTVEFKNLKMIPWLAGRGYNIVFVTVSAVWVESADPVAGQFQLVVWESRADPIITGRDELGIAKLYAEIPDLRRHDSRVSATASWDGFPFLEFDLADGAPSTCDQSALPNEGDPTFQWKYIPATGAWGEADVSYPVMTPPSSGNASVVAAEHGRAAVRFRHAQWHQLPTLVNVVNKLADLGATDGAAGGTYRTIGGSDRREQMRLEVRSERF